MGLDNALGAAAGQPAKAGSNPARERSTSFDDGWSFAKGDIPDAQSPQYTGGNWTPVDLPHDWSIAGPFSETEPSATREGICRRHRLVSQDPSGFREAMRDGGYCCSSTACTSAAMSGSTASTWARGPMASPLSTTISVRICTSATSQTWWRCAWITRISPICAGTRARESIATPGSSTPDRCTSISGARASPPRRYQGDCHGRGLNAGAESAGAGRALQAEPRRSSTRELAVQSAETEAEIPAGGEHVFVQRIAVPQPKLWSHTSPTLYSARQVLHHGMKEADAATTPFGIRSIEFDADKGFLLNGERVKLNGVCLHDDGARWARGTGTHMGAALRTAEGDGLQRHPRQPQSARAGVPRSLRPMGFLVMAEAFDEWREPKGQTPHYGYHRYFDEWSARDLKDMIARDRNIRPS